VPAAGELRIAIFCPTFLKPEMLHVYRQVVGLKAVTPILLTFKRENSASFPFDAIRFVQRSRFRWLRRIWRIQLRKAPPLAYPHEVRSISALLTADQCRLLHIYFGNNGLFWLPLMRRCPVPIVVSFHGADAGVNVDSPVARRLFRDLFASCTLVLARSGSLASALSDLGCPRTKLRIHHAGIPLDIFRYVPRLRPADGAWRLLQACRLIAKKGLEMTIRAFAAFSKRHPNASLTIAGDGPLRGALEEMTTRLRLEGRIHFAGFVSQSALLDLYRKSHLFLHPSEQTPDGDREGIPNSLLEAMATGLPCITTRHAGIPEAVSHLESGIMVRESDQQGIVEWLESLTCDDELRNSLGVRAARVIAEKFDLALQIEKLEEIYLSLA
jgi:colanic acid/amylovoran biosynthesis glycosyltransferase